MTSAPPPSIGKTRARRVFGDIVIEEADRVYSNNSLTYSPSPVSIRKSPDHKASLDDHAPMTITFLEAAQQVAVTSASSNKENYQRSADAELHVSFSGDITDRTDRTVAVSTLKQQELHRLRSQSRSPLRPDLVKKTQEAIIHATNSVNESLNAVRRAKAENYVERAIETAKIRENWREEKEDAKSFYAEAEKNRRELLTLQRQLSAKFNQAKAQRDTEERKAKLVAVDEESQFKSEVFRNHMQTLKEEQDNKRRHSVEARRKIRENNRQGEEKLRMMQIQEEHALLEERHLSSVAWRETKKANADQRRRSFAFRNGDAHRIRELYAKMEAERFDRDHMSYELKWAGERDAIAYARHLAEQRRNSFAFRNKEGRRQREDVQLKMVEEQRAEHASYELKWAAEKDTEAFARRMDEERRASFALRNSEGRKQRENSDKQQTEEQSAEHASYELKWAGERDVEEYERCLAAERRASLAFRNSQAHRQREEASQRKALEHNAEHQSFELKWAGEKDVEEYQRRMATERRESFAFRNKEAHRQREEASKRTSQDQNAEHQSLELKWAGEKDIEAHKRHLEQERRNSFKFRNEERARHQRVMEELKMLSREREAESLMLKWAGENDAKAYLAQLEEERRQSLQFRNKEGKRHRDLEEEAYQQSIQKAHVEEALQAACRRDVEEYEKTCAARDRASLCLRMKEANIQRLEEENRRQQQMKIEESNRRMEDAARGDVAQYIQDCKARRRLSLAFRAKEKRHHARWERDAAERRREEQSRDTRARAMDRRFMELARQQERARIAMDALRHAGRSFSVNPFAGLLD